jgi:hypothetical protein
MGKGMIEEEFLPLPYFPWAARPSHAVLEVEECATALYLEAGVVSRAAGRLRVEPLRLQRAINRSGRLRKLHAELVALLNDKVHEEVVKAFGDEDSRRREWASSRVMNSKQFQDHPLAPSNHGSPQLSISAENNNITFVWRTEPLRVDGGDGASDSASHEANQQASKTIDHEAS